MAERIPNQRRMERNHRQPTYFPGKGFGNGVKWSVTVPQGEPARNIRPLCLFPDGMARTLGKTAGPRLRTRAIRIDDRGSPAFGEYGSRPTDLLVTNKGSTARKTKTGYRRCGEGTAPLGMGAEDGVQTGHIGNTLDRAHR
jgi:hypothetical protein